jgi:hypothetical protein
MECNENGLLDTVPLEPNSIRTQGKVSCLNGGSCGENVRVVLVTAVAAGKISNSKFLSGVRTFVGFFLHTRSRTYGTRDVRLVITQD